jgi:hypothetical protein
MAKETYKVTGSNAVRGHAPGDEFEADLSAADKAFYIDGGHLTTVTRSKGEKPAPHTGGEQKEKHA